MTNIDSLVRAESSDIQRLMDLLESLSGGIWLATDLTTLCHWTIMAHSVVPVDTETTGRTCRAFGLATICAADAQPVFLINERDTLEWIEKEHLLAIRELGDASCEIRLERLDDLDARFIATYELQAHATKPTLRMLAVGHGTYLQIYDEQLPTGVSAADDELSKIEQTIEARRTLIGPASGTLEVLNQMEHLLGHTVRAYDIRSHVWAAVLRERIADLRHAMAA